MADQTFILFIGSDRWALHSPKPVAVPVTEMSFGQGSRIQQIADQMGAALKTAGYRGNPIGICLTSTACLSASIDIKDISRNDSRAMLYQMEEKLPLAAESVIADFIAAQDTALGVCARLDAIAPLVEALEAAGIVVQSITPTAVAACQGFARASLKNQAILLISEPFETDIEFVNVMLIENSLLTRWSVVPGTLFDLKLQLDLLCDESPIFPEIHAIDLDPGLVGQLTSASGQAVKPADQNAVSLACVVAAAGVENGVKPWVEFRRDQLAAADPLRLHRKWTDLALVAGIVLMVSVAIACMVRGYRYREADQQNTHVMVAAFQQHFPTRDIPIDIRVIVDAEYRRAKTNANPSASSRGAGSALITLHDVLIPLMAQNHFQISRMAFHESAFEITGRIQSYDQLDALCKSARVDGMVVTPAQTQKDTDGTWTFTLQGSKPTVAAAN